MESIYLKLALCGSQNECTRTDNVFFPISQVCTRGVTLTKLRSKFLVTSKGNRFFEDICSAKHVIQPNTFYIFFLYKGHPPSADLRYGDEDTISPSTLIFAARKG